MTAVHLYHTNDWHSHFDYFSRLNTYFDKERKLLGENQEQGFFIDTGDFMDRFNPITEATLGKANTRFLNTCGFDFVTIGNNEGITFTKKDLAAAYSEKDFEILCCNLFHEDGKRPEWCLPYVIKTLPDGIKIAFTGATAPFYPFYHKLGWKILDPLEILPELGAALRKEADAVVLLSHLGLPSDEKLADMTAAFDVILGSHTHHFIENGKRRNGTLICQNGKFGTHAGHITLDFNKSGGLSATAAKTVDLQEYETDEAAARLLEDSAQRSSTALAKPIAVLKEPYNVSWYEETPLIRLLADTLKEWCESDVGFINAGVLLNDLPAGPVSKGDLHRICPHPINPCKVQLTGEELLKVIAAGSKEDLQTFALKGFGFRGKVIGCLVFSGLEKHASGFIINGKPLDKQKRYSVATTDMFTFGRLLPPIKAAENKHFYLPEMLRDLLAWKLQLKDFN